MSLGLEDDPSVSFERDVRLDGPDGIRQFDLVIEKEIPGLGAQQVAVECKDYKKRVGVELLDAFTSKIRDFGMQGIFVNRAGYTKTAYRKAKRLGIQLLTLNDGPERLRSIGIRFPLLVIEMCPSNIQVAPTFRSPPDGAIVDVTVVSGRRIDSFVSEWIVENPQAWNSDGWIEVDVEVLKPWTISWNQRDLPLESLSVRIELATFHYFGFLDERESTSVLQDETTGARKYVYLQEDLFDYRTLLNRYDSRSAIPHEPVMVLMSVADGFLPTKEVRFFHPSSRR